MSRVLYISDANYDRKHLENCKIGLENCRIFSSKRVGTPPIAYVISTCLMHVA